MPAAYLLQCVFSLTLLVAAVICIRVGTQPARPRQRSDALWLLTGGALLFHGCMASLHNVFGGIALAGGPGSRAWAAYLWWDPVMNHSRTFLMDGLMVLLAMAAVRRQDVDRLFWLMAVAILAVGFGLGAVLGVYEGRFTEVGHYSAAAVWDVAELLLVFATLLTLLLSNAADRFLWMFLSAYGVSLALGVFWLVLFAQLNVPGTWHPPVWTLHALRLACYVTMAVVAARALARRRRGEALPGMLGPRARVVPSLR